MDMLNVGPKERMRMEWRDEGLVIGVRRRGEHLGAFAVEPLELRAGRLIGSAVALAGLAWLGALSRLLPSATRTRRCTRR